MYKSNDESQLWSLTLTDDGADSIANKATGLVVDDTGWSASAGNGMDLWTSSGGANQE